jgi:hypothetical protein
MAISHAEINEVIEGIIWGESAEQRLTNSVQ